MTITSKVLDILYNPHCLVCGIDVISHENRLCQACDPDFPRKLRDGLRSRYDQAYKPKNNHCNLCEEQTVSGSDLCLACHLSPLEADHLVSFWRYTEKVEKLIHAIKYKDAYPLIPLLAKKASKLIPMSSYSNRSWDYIVPIASAREIINQRGYQHMSLFAKELGRIIGVSVKPLTLRIETGSKNSKFTRQALVPIGDRAKNIEGLMTLGKTKVSGKKILLVDDVLTTGSSTNEAAKVLKENGALSVEVLTLARSTQFTECRILAHANQTLDNSTLDINRANSYA